MTLIKTLMLAAAVAAIGTTGAMAQDAMKAEKPAAHDAMAADKMAPHDAMATDAMATDHMAGKKMTKAEMKKHDAMMKKDAMASKPH